MDQVVSLILLHSERPKLWSLGRSECSRINTIVCALTKKHLTNSMEATDLVQGLFWPHIFVREKVPFGQIK